MWGFYGVYIPLFLQKEKKEIVLLHFIISQTIKTKFENIVIANTTQKHKTNQ